MNKKTTNGSDIIDLDKINFSHDNENRDQNISNDSGIQEDQNLLNSSTAQVEVQSGRVTDGEKTGKKPGPKSKCLLII